jgi:hypothetical protein
MKVASYKRIQQEDTQEAPEWTEYLYPLINIPLEQVVSCLQNKVTFSDNFLAEVQTVTVNHGVDKTIYLQKLNSKPLFVIPGYASGELVTACSIVDYETALRPIINVRFQSATSDDVDVAVVFIAG